MLIVKPQVNELVQKADKKETLLVDMFKHIELVGRTCYKSEDKITDDSCFRFVDMLKSHAHGAMLEHGTVYLTVFITASDKETFNYRDDVIRKLRENPYTKFNHRVDNGNYYYFTTNYRVIIENGWEDLMNEFQSECTEYHPKRKTFKFICNRGVSHEFVRHRVFSFGQESQRYCNYSKDKYGNQITFVEPSWLNKCKDLIGWSIWSRHMESCQDSYFQLLNQGKKPQEARGVLPNDTKTELCMTGFESDWDAFFKLRCAPDAHPEAQYLANMCRDIFNKGTL